MFGRIIGRKSTGAASDIPSGPSPPVRSGFDEVLRLAAVGAGQFGVPFPEVVDHLSNPARGVDEPVAFADCLRLLAADPEDMQRLRRVADVSDVSAFALSITDAGSVERWWQAFVEPEAFRVVEGIVSHSAAYSLFRKPFEAFWGASNPLSRGDSETDWQRFVSHLGGLAHAAHTICSRRYDSNRERLWWQFLSSRGRALTQWEKHIRRGHPAWAAAAMWREGSAVEIGRIAQFINVLRACEVTRANDGREGAIWFVTAYWIESFMERGDEQWAEMSADVRLGIQRAMREGSEFMPILEAGYDALMDLDEASGLKRDIRIGRLRTTIQGGDADPVAHVWGRQVDEAPEPDDGIPAFFRGPEDDEDERADVEGESPAPGSGERAAAPLVVVLRELRGAPPKADDAAEAYAMMKPIAGTPLPLTPAVSPDDYRARMLKQFPHAVDAIEATMPEPGMDHGRLPSIILLLGAPGASKSTLAAAMMDAYGLRWDLWQVGGRNTGIAGGLDRGFSTSLPSAPVRLVGIHRCANPGVVIDELDKAGGNRETNGNFHDAVNGFLEESTARKVHDPCLDSVFDLSFVSYAATANELSGLPQHILDRFTVVRFPAPTAEAIPAIGERLARRYLKRCLAGAQEEYIEAARLDAQALDELLALWDTTGSRSLRDFQRATAPIFRAWRLRTSDGRDIADPVSAPAPADNVIPFNR